MQFRNKDAQHQNFSSYCVNDIGLDGEHIIEPLTQNLFTFDLNHIFQLQCPITKASHLSFMATEFNLVTRIASTCKSILHRKYPNVQKRTAYH